MSTNEFSNIIGDLQDLKLDFEQAKIGDRIQQFFKDMGFIDIGHFDMNQFKKTIFTPEKKKILYDDIVFICNNPLNVDNKLIGDMYRILAIISDHLGYTKEELQLTQYALNYYPERLDLLNLYGNCFRKQNSFQKALEVFEKAYKINPDDSNTLRNIGVIYSSLGNISRAQEYLKKAINKDPNNPDHLCDLGITFVTQKNTKEAEKIYLQALKINPNHALALCELGTICMSSSRFNEALAYFEKSITINKQDYITWANIGLLYVNKKEIEKAIPFLFTALTLSPSNWPSRAMIEKLYSTYNQNPQKKNQSSHVQKIPEFEKYMIKWKCKNCSNENKIVLDKKEGQIKYENSKMVINFGNKLDNLKCLKCNTPLDKNQETQILFGK